MITLKDYIGKIYKEVTNAKVQSDIETLAIAQEYVQNPMLKHFSVPNIRIKNMELTIPVAVDKTESVARDYEEREIKDVYMNAFESTYLSFRPTKTDFFDSIKLDLSKKAELAAADATPQLQQARIEDEQAQQPTSYTASIGLKYTEALRRIASNFAVEAYAYVDGDIPREEFDPIITKKIEAALVPKSPAIEELPVIVETQRLKEISDPASMIMIKVNIMDDAMEWTTDVDADGNAIQVLNYE